MLTSVELRQKRAALINQARDFYTNLESPTAEDEQKFERMMAEADQLQQRFTNLERLESEAREAGRLLNDPIKPATGEPRHSLASEEYRNAFWKHIKTGDRSELRVLNITAPGQGQELFPDEYEKQLIMALRDRNVMRQLATTIPTSHGTLDVPAVLAQGNAAWTGESQQYNESDDEFGIIQLGAFKATRMIRVTEELLHDNVFPLEGYIRDSFVNSVATLEEAAFVNGAAPGQPRGFLPLAQPGVQAAAPNAITPNEILATFHSLRRPYRDKASWLMSDATALAIRQLQDTTGQYIWQPGLQAGQPDRILGRPLYISDNMPNIAAGNRVMAFGDFSYYWIADRVGITVQRLTERYAELGQVGFLISKRVDGMLMLNEAITTLSMA